MFPSHDPEGENLNINPGKSDVPACQAIAICKTDLDRALQHLNRKEQLVVICSHVIGFSYSEIGFWLDCESRWVERFDDIALNKMYRYLNCPT